MTNKKYEVVVGNIGTVVSTNKLLKARSIYKNYCYDSTLKYGRASGETVVIFCDGEILDENIKGEKKC